MTCPLVGGMLSILFVVLAFLKIKFATQHPGLCSNVSLGKTIECCENYQLIHNSCSECPLGTHGLNCSKKCPRSFYGRLCREKCLCDPCDKVIGCFNLTDSLEDNSTFHWPTLLIFVSAGFAMCFITSIVFSIVLRCREKKVNDSKPEDIKSSGDNETCSSNTGAGQDRCTWKKNVNNSKPISLKISEENETCSSTAGACQDRYDHVLNEDPGYVTLMLTS